MHYERVGFHESHGQISLGVQVFVGLENMTQEEIAIAGNMASECHEKLLLHRINNDPKNIACLHEEKKAFLSLFPSLVYVKEETNPYWPTYTFKKKFVVTTQKGPIAVWWRKRVIVIDWSQSEIKSFAEDLFPDENVTKSDWLIHADSYAKAKEYINKVMAS